jgi:hypothetical protein
MKKQEELTWAEIKAMFAETDKKFKKTDKKFHRTEKRMYENDRMITEKFKLAEKRMYENDRMITEKFKLAEKRMAENDRMLTEKFNLAEKRMAENDRMLTEKFDRTEKMIANSNQRIEGISKSNGEFCEEYFVNCFKENPFFLGEKYDYVIERLRPYPVVVIEDEYDLVLHNGSSVVLIEMKYKANFNDVGKMFSKLQSYRANYPMYNHYKIYLCLASFRFPANVRAHAAENGIVLIQQRGEKIEVISKNIKTW